MVELIPNHSLQKLCDFTGLSFERGYSKTMLSQVNVLVIFLATLLVLVTIVSCQIVSFITLANLTSATDLGVAAAIGITAAFNVQNVKRGGLNGNQLNLQIIDTNDITNTTVTLFNFPASVFAFM